MPTRTHPLLTRRAIACCLLAAPVFEVVEQVLSPLAGTSTAADLAAIQAHEGRFVTSVLFGMLATALYLPALVGLASVTSARSPWLSRVAAACALLSMLGFFGVRMLQAFQLQVVRDGLPTGAPGAGLLDHTVTNPLGATQLVLFLGGSLVGVLALAAAAWRAGLPRPASLLLAAFPFADLGLPGHLGTIASHCVLLVALAWMAAHLLADDEGRLTQGVAESVAAA